MKFRRTMKTFDRIDITSLIDVVSFIVIYFLINATLEKGTSIKIELPRSSTTVSKEKNQDELIITVDKVGKIFLDRDPKKNKVIIRGDSGANYQTVVKVIDEVNAAGVTRFNLAMVKGSNSQSQTADEEK